MLKMRNKREKVPSLASPQGRLGRGQKKHPFFNGCSFWELGAKRSNF